MDDEDAPLDPVRVTLFVLFLAGLGFGAWRLYAGRKAVTAVKEASKDYRKLFPSRAEEAQEAQPPKLIVNTAPTPSSILLQVDEEMKIKKPAPVAAPAASSATAATAEPAPAPAKTAATAKTMAKPIPQARLNSGAFSRLNGGSGVGFSGGNAGGGGAAAPAGKPGAAPAMPEGMPDLSKIPGMPAGGIPGLPTGTDKK